MDLCIFPLKLQLCLPNIAKLPQVFLVFRGSSAISPLILAIYRFQIHIALYIKHTSRGLAALPAKFFFLLQICVVGKSRVCGYTQLLPQREYQCVTQ